MAHKINQAIEVTYQAAGAQSGLSDVQMDVYDETHVVDAPKGGTMTEIGSTGRYYKSFTPDAEGEWTVMINSATAPGKVVKKYSVKGHDVNSVGDAVAALNDVSSSDIDTALATYDGPTKAEMDSGLAALNDISSSDVATELATYDAPTKAELDSAESNIRGGNETLETIKTAIDGLPQSAAPMVG
jgi:hypothetical protein